MVSTPANHQNETTGSFSDLVLRDHDAAGHELLVGLHAIALGFAEHENLPQQSLLQQADRRASWHALWVALSVGDKAKTFKAGDQIWQSGQFSVPPNQAEIMLLDSRIIDPSAHCSVSPMQNASLMSSELVVKRLKLNQASIDKPRTILLIDAFASAGAELLARTKKLDHVNVIATAATPQLKSWLIDQGAQHVIDYHKPWDTQLKALGISHVSDLICLRKLDTATITALLSG